MKKQRRYIFDVFGFLFRSVRRFSNKNKILIVVGILAGVASDQKNDHLVCFFLLLFWIKLFISSDKSCEEGTAANRRRSGLEWHRFKTQRLKGLFTAESPLKCTLPIVICIHHIMCGMYWLTVHLHCSWEIQHELNKVKIHQGGATLY